MPRTLPILLAIALAAFAVACDDDDPRVFQDFDTGHGDDVLDLPDVSDPDTDTDASDSPDTDTPDVSDVSDADADPNGDLCQPRQDGTITADQVPMEAGLSAPYLVTLDAELHTAGEVVDGTRTWDLSIDLPGDETVDIVTIDTADQWFADDFPTATYATRLTHDEDLLGVFEATDDALLLLGVVSPEDGLFDTRLTYDPPVEILRFPLAHEDSWSRQTTVSGRAQGTFPFYTETYTSEVDRRGELLTPFGTFQVLRVRTEMVRTIGLLTYTYRTFAFVSPCFGTVATIRSQEDESSVEFTDTAEIRRLTL